MLKGLIGHIIWIAGAIGLIGLKLWFLKRLEKYKQRDSREEEHEPSSNNFVHKDYHDLM